MLFWLVSYEYIKSKLFSAEILEWTDSTRTYNGDMLLLLVTWKFLFWPTNKKHLILIIQIK